MNYKLMAKITQLHLTTLEEDKSRLMRRSDLSPSELEKMVMLGRQIFDAQALLNDILAKQIAGDIKRLI